ncbi:unnamed protein product [Rotaria sordida]|uniref:Peptidase M28 domain-containing protein n=2 Tax=Rotaria sordida TaxID=392033 RepID=A0A819AMB9_9BILA|nr:unnamed protein product [Rotaria sordida]CAF3801071.1 unnamed protein product [Rotaria sordida]
MFHLKQLQTIADKNNGTRTLGTSGFKATLDYIETQLRSKTNFQIFKQEFFVPVLVTSNPILTSTIDGIDKNYTYGTDFREIIYSPSANFLTSIRLTVVPNFGCDDNDWKDATPYPVTDSVILVMYSQNCSVTETSIVAQKYNISGLLVYDSNINGTYLPFIIGAQNITYPAMILSYELGTQLVEATKNHSLTNPSVRMFITPGNTITRQTASENICADTPTGNKTQTIVIGSHSDSVAYSPGINDNGSGAMATLVLALNLAHLFQTLSYEEYLYRIRFCWWAAEENGLLGSYHHIEEANVTAVEGNRLKDYVMMLNFDMLASPNYFFGIYESTSLPDTVSSTVKNASLKISQLFRNWFDKEKLPWDDTSLFSISDHFAFVVAGVACGGTFSGAPGIKTFEQRDRYNRMLGHGHGGIAGASFDPCYHQACDTLENINPFVYETMVKSAAYALETFARIPDLYLWLYQSSTTTKN